MARHSIESTFRASVLGNWEVPRQAKRRSGGGSSYASSFGGSVASRRSSRSRASSRPSRRPGSHVSIIVDEHGHLLPQHKKNDSSFRYEITDSKDPVAKSAGMFVTWDEFDNVQDQLATNALSTSGSDMALDRVMPGVHTCIGSTRCGAGAFAGTTPRSTRPCTSAKGARTTGGSARACARCSST